MRVWFITGTSSGLGRALARRVVERGDAVVATARRAATLDDLVAAAPDRVLAQPLDVTAPGQPQSAVRAAVARFGRIDVVVNNAGYGVVGALEELTDEQVRAQFDTNVHGVLAVLRAALPQLRAQGSGHVVNVSSVAGLRASPGLGAYAASKHAVEGLSEALAAEVAGFGIGVTIVEPGAFRTSWAGGSMVSGDRLPAYAGTPSDGLRDALRRMDGRQDGDPDRAAAAIVEAVTSERPPLRLPLGDDAVAVLATKGRTYLRTAQDGGALARSTTFSAGTAGTNGDR